MPDLILVKGNGNPPSILDTIFETEGKKFPICNDAFLQNAFLVTLAAFSKDVPIEAEQVNILIVFDFGIKFKDVFIAD